MNGSGLTGGNFDHWTGGSTTSGRRLTIAEASPRTVFISNADNIGISPLEFSGA